MKQFSSYLFVGVLSFSLIGLSESKKSTKANKNAAAVEALDDSVWMNPPLVYGDTEAYTKKIEALKKRPRKAASDNNNTDVPAIEKTFQADFVLLRDKLIGNGKKEGV